MTTQQNSSLNEKTLLPLTEATDARIRRAEIQGLDLCHALYKFRRAPTSANKTAIKDVIIQINRDYQLIHSEIITAQTQILLMLKGNQDIIMPLDEGA